MIEIDRHGYLDLQPDGHWAPEPHLPGRSISNRTINRLIEARKITRLGTRVIKQEDGNAR